MIDQEIHEQTLFDEEYHHTSLAQIKKELKLNGSNQYNYDAGVSECLFKIEEYIRNNELFDYKARHIISSALLTDFERPKFD